MKIISFDIEEWFHINNSDWKPVDEWVHLESKVENNTKIILDFLRTNKIKASFFVLGWVAEKYPELIKEIFNEGHDIGYHSYFHRIPKTQSKKEFENDLIKGLDLLKKITGKEVICYRAPNFSLKNKWMLDCLYDNGIRISSSIKSPMRNNGIELPKEPYILSRGKRKIIELPLVRERIGLFYIPFSGSGYFRVLPYFLIKTLLKKTKYQMLYFHPNDFDTNIPKTPELSIFRNFLNMVGTDTTLKKLQNLTNNFTFFSISQMLEKINIKELKKINY